MKRCFAAQSIFQNMMFCNVDGAAVLLLLTVPVGSCSCEAVELSFSCLRRLKTWSKGGRRVCEKGTTFTVLWTNQTLSPCLLCFSTLAAMTALCEIFNLLYFRSTAQMGGGAWPKGTNGKYASVVFYFCYTTWNQNKTTKTPCKRRHCKVLRAQGCLPTYCCCPHSPQSDLQ